MSCNTKTGPGIKAIQNEQWLTISWDHPSDEHRDPISGLVQPNRRPPLYEVRMGPSDRWQYMREVYRGASRTFRTCDFIAGATEYIAVRAISPTGHYSPKTLETSVTTIHPLGHTDELLRDELTLGWPGSKSGVEVEGGGDNLILESGALSGTYESPEIDLGVDDVWFLGHRVWIDWRDTARTLGSFKKTLGDLAGTKLKDLRGKRLRDYAYRIGDPWAFEENLRDKVYDPSATYKLEWDISSEGGFTPTYECAGGGSKAGRYLRFRLTITRKGLTTQTTRVTSMLISASRPAAGTPASGLDVKNILSYGGKEGAAEDNSAALDAAIAAAEAEPNGGAVVYVPPGIWGVSKGHDLGTRVRLMGAGAGASQLRIISASWGVGTYMIRLGKGTGTVFNTRIEHLGLNVNNVASIDCVYSNEAQEGCGVFHCQFDDYLSWGINFEQSGTACSVVEVYDVVGFPGTAGSGGGIRFAQVQNSNRITQVSFSQSAGGTHGDGILIDASDVTVRNAHVEFHTDGVHVQNGGGGRILDVHGHNSLTNVVHIDTGILFVSCENIRKSGASVTILDDEESETITADVVERYAKRESSEFRLTARDKLWKSGMTATRVVQANAAGDSLETSGYNFNPTQISANKMLHIHSDGSEIRAIRDLPLGAVVGTTDEQTLEKKTFKVAGGGSWASAAFKIRDSSDSFNYDIVPAALGASRTINIPALTGADTLIFQLQAQEMEAKTFVVAGTGSFVNTAFRVRSPGTSFDFAFDPPGSLGLSRTITWPLPTQATSTLPFLEQAQEFTGQQSFSGGLRIEDGDASPQWLTVSVAGALAADRTLQVPVLTGTRTLALIDQAQEFTAQQSFSGGVRIEDGDASPQWVTIDVSGALAADRTLSVPVLTGNDTIVTEAHEQTLTNKVLDGIEMKGTWSLPDGVSIMTIASNITYTGENQYNGAFVFNAGMVQGDSGPGRFKLQTKSASFSSQELELWIEDDGAGNYTLNYDAGAEGVKSVALT